TYGIRIAKDGANLFTVDNNGNLVLRNIDASGTITSSNGNIGGWLITSKGLELPDGTQYIGSDGSGELGLMKYTKSTAEFRGNIYAKNLNLENNDDVKQFQDHVETVVNNAIKNISNNGYMDVIRAKTIYLTGDEFFNDDGYIESVSGYFDTLVAEGGLLNEIYLFNAKLWGDLDFRGQLNYYDYNSGNTILIGDDIYAPSNYEEIGFYTNMGVWIRSTLYSSYAQISNLTIGSSIFKVVNQNFSVYKLSEVLANPDNYYVLAGSAST
ncbi:MAG: hypothetical protein LIO46_02355, partial [Clostridiales bacterium]|nr:hypothetical protein [Clostridiales bacterium]